jgi:hypothetical protein
MVNMGIPLNAVIQRLKLGVDPVDGGDVGLVPVTNTPLALVTGGDTTTL